ncbi:MAG TPA: hypothetical protein VF680_00935 [Allosphingosinicella sp.]|jgi:predicted DNA-binding protein YlxM (UPF0122 family)
MITLDEISKRIDNYLHNIIDGVDLVNCVDDAVSTDAVYDYDDKAQAIIMKYQDLLALYVDNAVSRSEKFCFLWTG